jgi:exosome complex component RRP4
MKSVREFVLPGEEVDLGQNKPGIGIYIENEKAYSVYLGTKSEKSGYLNIMPLAGKYFPEKGDKVIGKIVDLTPTNWVVDINAPYMAPLHVNDVPWRIEFGDTSRFLNIGDVVLVKVSNITESNQIWVSMKEPGLRKLEGGFLITVSPTKVSRIIGKEGSMIKILKEATNTKIYVGQNGEIWIDGEPKQTLAVIKAIRIIEREAHTIGLTDRIKTYLEGLNRSEQK